MASNSNVQDPYLVSPDGVLRNLVGATSYAELAKAEADLVSARTVQLVDRNVVAHSRDDVELRALHQHPFQDMYDWAGQYRTIDMKKDLNGEFFAPAPHIRLLVNSLMLRLQEGGSFKDLSKSEFVTELVQFYDELNYIHPFREGNGRTQRVFWSRVSFDAGWILDWRPIHGDELNEASRTARENSETGQLQRALLKCIRPR